MREVNSHFLKHCSESRGLAQFKLHRIIASRWNR